MNSAKKLDDAALGELAGRVARQQVMAAGVLANVNGSVVYQVGEGWEANQIKQDSKVLQVASPAELEAGLENVAVETLFVPRDAAITLELLKTVLGRHGQAKTVFFEKARPAPVE